MIRSQRPFVAAPLLLLVACAAREGAEAPAPGLDTGPITEPVVLDPDWTLEVAYAGSERINGVACGDLDPSLPGDEIVSVDRRGRIRLLGRRDGAFTELELPWPVPMRGLTSLGEADGELVQVAAGDLDPAAPGDEVVAVGVQTGGEDDGGPGILRLLSRSGADGGWREQRFTTPALVHAVAIGDVFPERPGLEVVFAGFFGEPLVGYVDGEGNLLVDAIGVTHGGNAKGACLTGAGFVLASDDGHAYRYERRGGAWDNVSTANHGAALARITGYGERDYAVCANDGTFQLSQQREGQVSTTYLHRTDNRLRGAVLADVDPAHPGTEACTAGYDGYIRVVRLHRQGVDGRGIESIMTSKRPVARDTAKIHHLAAGFFDGIGTALVSCGYSGQVLVVHPR